VCIQHHILTTLRLGRSPGTHCRGGYASHRAILDKYGEEKISCPHQGWKPGLSCLLWVTVLTLLISTCKWMW